MNIIWKQTGKKPEQLDTEKCPDFLMYLWRWFLELNSARQYSEVGAMPITYSEILAWSQLSGNEIAPIEVQVIKRLDTIATSTKGG